MNIELKKIKDINSENCITIILNTHRTSPENLQDPVKLKNLVKEAEERLLAEDTKRDVKQLIENLKKLSSSIDHNQNIESLILFVNEEIAEYVRLPIEVEERVIIDKTFATRDLIRAMHSESEYYVLVLNQQKARLIQAFNDKVVEEITEGFPMENIDLFSTKKSQTSFSSRQTNLDAEFFNRVDKELNNVRKNNPLPVLVCAQETNYFEYMKVADKKEVIFDTYLNKNILDSKNHLIVEQAWEIIQEYISEQNNQRKETLMQSIGDGNVLSGIHEIWKAIHEGRVKTIFIEQGLFQPAIVEENELKLVPDEQRELKKVIDDIYDEMIEINMDFGGDVVFLPKGELKDFDGFAAITRY